MGSGEVSKVESPMISKPDRRLRFFVSSALSSAISSEAELGEGFGPAHAEGHKLSVEEAIQLIADRFDADPGAVPGLPEPASTRRR